MTPSPTRRTRCR